MIHVEIILPYPKPVVTNTGLILAETDHNDYDEYRRFYRFCLYEENLVVDKFAFEGKNKRQKNWRTIEAYNRTVWLRSGCDLSEDNVPLDGLIKADAKQALSKKIKVCKWSERRETCG